MGKKIDKVEEVTTSPADELAPVKMPIFKTMLSPFSIFIDNIKKTASVIGIFAVFLSLISLTARTPYICSFSPNDQIPFGCSTQTYVIVAANLLAFLASVMFAVKYHAVLFSNKKIELKKIFIPTILELKAIAFLLVIIASGAVPLLSIYLLMIRVPDPDWIIETIYFGFVSIGFLFPFAVMRFYSIFSFILEGEKIPPLKNIWTLTTGNGLKIVLSIFTILAFTIFYIAHFKANFIVYANSTAFYIVLILEYLYNFSILTIFSFFINHCHTQREILFGGKQNVLR